VYKKEYIERMKASGKPIETNETELRFSINDVKESLVKEFGLTEMLDKLAKHFGLREALEVSNPKYSDEIFALAKHLAASGEPFMHCEEWLENVEISENIGSLSSQNISKILADISMADIERFYQEWAKKRSETEYLALDITSASSYSELIEDVEWGYNRDGEDLAQVNLCMLMGEVSRLPVYQTAYQGSLKDVSTLKTTLAKLDKISNGKKILVVMDKGFFSNKNIDELIAGDKKFVIAVPFSNSFAKNQVNDLKSSIDDFSNNIVIGGDSLRAIVRKCKWGKGFVYAHVYYNPIKAVADREKLYKKVADMLEKASVDPEKYLGNKEFGKYINIEQISEGYQIDVKKEAVLNANKHAGWLVIISNHAKNALETIKIYRSKDVVEKGFLKIKNSLDLARLRVHSDSAMQSKIFICFVSLVLLSHIHNVMADNGLYKQYTLKQLMRVLSKRRVQTIGETRIEYPITKEQRDIYSAFGI
ncbi:MAG: transposase, partial [Clostridiales bacterium]|jgi:transposase|nr:transposase [Clostridiales bacterium]